MWFFQYGTTQEVERARQAAARPGRHKEIMDTSKIPPEILQYLDEGRLKYFEEDGITTEPKDYYFKVFTHPDGSYGSVFKPGCEVPISITIVPKKHYDANGGIWYDQHISQAAGGLLKLAPDYNELAEVECEPTDPNATVASIEADLKARGLIHNPNL